MTNKLAKLIGQLDVTFIKECLLHTMNGKRIVIIRDCDDFRVSDEYYID